jgi:hypothetical protein
MGRPKGVKNKPKNSAAIPKNVAPVNLAKASTGAIPPAAPRKRGRPPKAATAAPTVTAVAPPPKKVAPAVKPVAPPPAVDTAQNLIIHIGLDANKQPFISNIKFCTPQMSAAWGIAFGCAVTLRDCDTDGEQPAAEVYTLSDPPFQLTHSPFNGTKIITRIAGADVAGIVQALKLKEQQTSAKSPTTMPVEEPPFDAGEPDLPDDVADGVDTLVDGSEDDLYSPDATDDADDADEDYLPEIVEDADGDDDFYFGDDDDAVVDPDNPDGLSPEELIEDDSEDEFNFDDDEFDEDDIV